MRIEETSNITSIQDYRKSRKKNIVALPNQSVPAKIIDFKVASSLHPAIQQPIDKDEVRAILDPDSKTPAKHKTSSDKIQTTPISASTIDFNTLASLFPNIKKSKESELIEFFMFEGYNLTYEQATQAIKNYEEDAELAKPVFDRVNQIFKEFEERIKGLDLSKFLA